MTVSLKESEPKSLEMLLTKLAPKEDDAVSKPFVFVLYSYLPGQHVYRFTLKSGKILVAHHLGWCKIPIGCSSHWKEGCEGINPSMYPCVYVYAQILNGSYIHACICLPGESQKTSRLDVWVQVSFVFVLIDIL